MLYSDNKEVNFSIARTVAFNKEKIGNYKLAPRTIAEFGIGTNKKAKILGVMICDEKTLGSCHFALGNNLSMGGKNDCYGHFDYVIANPTVWADGKKIVEGGKILL
jgi:leucyl aminopeptidase (aminopeptidase T)